MEVDGWVLYCGIRRQDIPHTTHSYQLPTSTSTSNSQQPTAKTEHALLPVSFFHFIFFFLFSSFPLSLLLSVSTPTHASTRRHSLAEFLAGWVCETLRVVTREYELVAQEDPCPIAHITSNIILAHLHTPLPPLQAKDRVWPSRSDQSSWKALAGWSAVSLPRSTTDCQSFLTKLHRGCEHKQRGPRANVTVHGDRRSGFFKCVSHLRSKVVCTLYLTKF